ncbi:glucose-6-phosphate 1-epimerase [Silvibacterium bohemicum]|uniref:Putative glucose-6-phosphate 1-epimerase n=1 Tax=Silvibacterium bohemicum TaxID=1577686 RepID=A0A841JXT2_9BACT|nr:D-hexose-6-phosphate mutarotase [Silvibacterium bohemicum]MBB6146156.1 glucose-6-phosphate 1-epimerase [Silvibacterium bohemicum]
MPSFVSIEKLNEQHAIAGIASVISGEGNLPKVRVTSPRASAEIYLHGAQVTSWQPAGSEDAIFLSAKSYWEEGRAIRGGIPVCFPWFRNKADDQKAPSHGFVRTKAWELLSIAHEGDSVVVTLVTESDEASRRWWPHEFRIVHRVTVGAELKLELVVTNTGDTALKFEEALHTYHRVGDAGRTRVAGLDGAPYLDNMDGNREKTQAGDVKFTGPTDNAYLTTRNAVEVVDPVLHRRIRTEKKNSLTTVVWNPWQEGAKALADLGDDEWQSMACAEAGNIRSNAVTLAPGEEHTMTATLAVEGDGR